MKQKLSVSIDDKLVEELVRTLSNNSKFRNKSHLVEYAVNKLMDDQDG